MEEVSGTRVKITDAFVPVGTHTFQVSSAANFKVGDRIIVYRPGTENWIHDIKMDQIVERREPANGLHGNITFLSNVKL